MLCANKQILSYAGLSHDEFIRIFKMNIPRLAVWITILLALVLCVILEILVCMHNYKNGIVEVLFSAAGTLFIVALALTYTTFIQKVNNIVRLVDYLEYFAKKSKDFKFFSSDHNETNTEMLTNTAISYFQARGMHHTRDCTLEKCIQTTYACSPILVCLSHAIPALCPVIYAFAGFPKPSYWFTPMRLHEA